MTRRLAAAAASLGSVALLAGCGGGGTASIGTAGPTIHSTPTAHPTPTPTPVPQGPFAVLVTNAPRSGTAYDVLLVDKQGAVVARASAQLPHLKPNQTVDLPLVSASNSRVYYLDGDTDIRSLSPAGTTAPAKSIPDGAKSAITFAVSPDDQRIAVLVLTEQSDSTKDTGHGYIEDLAGTGNHLDLFNNIGQFSFRWPVGWHGTSVIDALGSAGCGPGGYGQNACTATAGSYHVVDGITGNRTATICENPATQPAGGDYYTVQGAAGPAGTTCYETQGNTYSNPPETDALMRVDWSGTEHQFLTKTSQTCCVQLGVSSCQLAPDGVQMACSSDTNQALTFVRADGSTSNTGRRYTVLGWIDTSHILVDLDPSTLGVLSSDTSALTTLALANANKVAMASALPGGF